MTKNQGAAHQFATIQGKSKPSVSISKIGIVSRNYQTRYPNGYRDFSHSFVEILNLLDGEGCDTVLFSLFSIIPREEYDLRSVLNSLKTISSVFLEEFQEKENRQAERYVVYHHFPSGWGEYDFQQEFGSVTSLSLQEVQNFVQDEVPKRILGSCCVLLCGETNGVKYSKTDKKIHDTFGLRKAIPQTVNVVLNPIHDRMTRFEMKLKRRFLSEHDRWVISPWNKGKLDKNGKTKDGSSAAWTVFHNGNELDVPRIPNTLGVEIGVLDVKKAQQSHALGPQ